MGPQDLRPRDADPALRGPVRAALLVAGKAITVLIIVLTVFAVLVMTIGLFAVLLLVVTWAAGVIGSTL